MLGNEICTQGLKSSNSLHLWMKLHVFWFGTYEVWDFLHKNVKESIKIRYELLFYKIGNTNVMYTGKYLSPFYFLSFHPYCQWVNLID